MPTITASEANQTAFDFFMMSINKHIQNCVNLGSTEYSSYMVRGKFLDKAIENLRQRGFVVSFGGYANSDSEYVTISWE